MAFPPPPPPPHPLPQQTGSPDALKKRIYIGFGAIVAVGLAVAGLYIGGRVFARSRFREKPLAVPAVAQTIAQPVVPKPSPIAAAPLQEPVAPKPAPVQAAPAVASAPPVAPAPIVEPPATNETTAAAVTNVITPKPGEKYLQLAANGPTFAGAYVKRLEAKGIHAVMAPGPSNDLYRVLVGPFTDQSSLEKQKDLLDAEGIQHMVRVY
jgi:cell division protein FtsN